MGLVDVTDVLATSEMGSSRITQGVLLTTAVGIVFVQQIRNLNKCWCKVGEGARAAAAAAGERGVASDKSNPKHRQPKNTHLLYSP